MNNDDNITPNGQTPESVTSTGQTATPQGQTTQSGSDRTPFEQLPADTQDYIKRLIDENKSYRKRAQDQERVAQTAQEQRLKEQGEFKQLAEKHEARVKELEPVAQSYGQLAELVGSQIESQIKDWPAELKAFDPGKDAPIEQRLAWLEKSKPLLEKLIQQVRAASPGNAPSPRPASSGGSKDVDELRTRYRESGKYGF